MYRLIKKYKNFCNSDYTIKRIHRQKDQYTYQYIQYIQFISIKYTYINILKYTKYTYIQCISICISIVLVIIS